jgi:hypothetical protein
MAREDFDCYVSVRKERIGMIDTVLFRANKVDWTDGFLAETSS